MEMVGKAVCGFGETAAPKFHKARILSYLFIKPKGFVPNPQAVFRQLGMGQNPNKVF